MFRAPVALFFAATFSLAAPAVAATINATTCSRADVGAAVGKAVTGDTVAIPAGTCAWTSTLGIDKGITLRGAGIDATVLVDEVPRTAGGVLLSASGAAPWHLTGFTIRRGTITEVQYQGTIIVSGQSKEWRISHVKFSRPAASNGIRIYGNALGVVDHCIFDMDGGNGILVWNDTWGGRRYGDGSWSDPLYLGTDKAIYIEDNVFTNTWGGAVDHGGGARIVFRHNKVNHAYLHNHGTESTGRYRSARSFEVYNNTFSYVDASQWFTAVYLRGGTGVIFNNTFTGYSSAIQVLNFRSDNTYSIWGKCDGTSSYDGNQQSNGYPCLDQLGRGTGSLIDGDTPTPLTWPGQVLDPLHVWGNRLNGGQAGSGVVVSRSSVLVRGRDYYDNVARPNYTPYTYPHPLTTGETSSTGGTTPSPLPAPTMLRVQ